MTPTEAIEEYMERHISAEPEWLRQCRLQTWRERLYPRMCSGPVQGALLTMLSAMAAPMKVLEIGTFSGYSAMALADGMPAGAVLHTVEIDDEHEEFILRQISRSPRCADIRLHIGDAMEVVPALDEQEWDLIFLDANKRQYPSLYRMLIPRLRPGGFLIADNTLWDGHVTDTQQTDAQTRGVDGFNTLVASDPCVRVSIVPVRDGLSIIRKLP